MRRSVRIDESRVLAWKGKPRCEEEANEILVSNGLQVSRKNTYFSHQRLTRNM
jgi:hypothetical protein